MSGKIAFIFPGQGSQYVGMGQAMAARFPVVADTFAEADAALGEPLSQLCFTGPEEQLRQTQNTQPAIVTASIALYRLLAGILQPDCVAGHSLGEYAALVAAESISFADAVRAVRRRGLLMEAAVPQGTGTMAAVLGLPENVVRDICSQAESIGVVAPATLNGGGQVVIAGVTAAVEEAAKLATAAGAKAVRMLNVSGPFHTSLLQHAGEQLAEVLATIEIADAKVPVYCNTMAQGQQSATTLRKALIDQVSHAVRWEESMQAMWNDGVRTFMEIGPGRVLSGLVRRTLKEAQVINIDDPDSWDKFLAWAKGNGVI